MKAKVIIVDDDKDTREQLKEVLELRGFNVAQAHSGLRLISYLHVDRPDVILLDVMMSWISGYELCRSIKLNPEFHDIPVCFITARADPGDVRTGMECGADAYFVKPVDTDQLLAAVERLVKPPAPPAQKHAG